MLFQGQLPNVRDLQSGLQVSSSPVSAKVICHVRQRDSDLD